MKLAKSKLKQLIKEEIDILLLEENSDRKAKQINSMIYLLKTEFQTLDLSDLSDNIRENLLKEAGMLASVIKQMRKHDKPYAGSEYKPKLRINYENN